MLQNGSYFDDNLITYIILRLGQGARKYGGQAGRKIDIFLDEERAKESER